MPTQTLNHRFWLLVMLAILSLSLVACNEQGGAAGDLPYFGNNGKDLTDVICRVAGIEITQQDMDLRYAELPKSLKNHYTGEGWEKRFLRFMADEALLVSQADLGNLTNHPLVMQQLISERRSTMIKAYKQFDIYEGAQPEESELRSYYNLNMERYTVDGAVRARHIQCQTKERAEAAYAALKGQGKDSQFLAVLAKYSQNVMTASEGGSLGWFNEGGYVRYISNGKELSAHVYGWDIGVHAPEYIGEDWHVIEILERKRSRQLAFSEVRERITADFMPSLQASLLEERLTALRKEAAPVFLGQYAPGSGRSVEELFQHGILANSPKKQLELFDLVIADFPESEYVPKALFMKANVYLDTWSDTRQARVHLHRLLQEYPESELHEQAQYIMDHMGQIDFSAPKSIQDLQRLSQ